MVVTQHRGTPSRRWQTSLYLGLLVYVVLASSHFRGFIFDDPFIFFRYARNLAEGHGWVFNVGSPQASAATSPFYVVLLAVGYKLGFHDLVSLSRLVFVAGLTACACLTHATLARLGHWWAGTAAALLVASSPWLFMTRGMETSLFLAVFALCLYQWVVGSGYRLGVSLAVLVLIRPDGVVLVVSILAAEWLAKRRVPWRILLAGALCAGIWACYAAISVGTFLPETLSAKMAQGHSGFWDSFINGTWQTPLTYGYYGLMKISAVLACIGLAIVLVRRELRSFALVAVGSVIVLMAAYVVLDVPGDYPWYYGPLVYDVAVLGGLAIEEMGRLLVRHLHGPLMAAPAVALTFVLVLAGTIETPSGPPRPGYVLAANWINEHTARSATITAAEIGELGWYTNHPMVDYLGLLSPRALAPLRRRDMIWWVNGLRPDYWMTLRDHPFGADLQVLQAPWFRQVFKEVYRNRTVVIYKRIATAPQD